MVAPRRRSTAGRPGGAEGFFVGKSSGSCNIPPGMKKGGRLATLSGPRHRTAALLSLLLFFRFDVVQKSRFPSLPGEQHEERKDRQEKDSDHDEIQTEEAYA